MSNNLLMAFALMLIIEGALPFAVPHVWREIFKRVTQMTNGQIRFFGLSSMICGMLLLFAFNR